MNNTARLKPSKPARLPLMSAVIAILAWQNPAFAATTGTLTLSGTVAAVSCSITVTAEGTANVNLPISDTSVLHKVKVGNVAQTCNNPGGYDLFVTSFNCASGALLSDGASHTLHYSVNADSTPQPPDETDPYDTVGMLQSGCGAPNTARHVAAGTGVAEHTSLQVQYTTPGTPLAAGTYGDVLTVTMQTN